MIYSLFVLTVTWILVISMDLYSQSNPLPGPH